MDQMKAEKDRLENKLRDNHEKKKKLQEKSNLDDKEKKQLEELTKEFVQLEKEMQDFCKREKLQPWNVDTLSQPKFSKTVINKKPEGPSYDEMTEDQKEQHMKKFVKENEKLIKQYGMLKRFDDSKKFLMEHNLLVHEDTANYLVIWCINLEMEEKHELMTHVAHQCICMQYILELARQLKCDPRACIGPFFERIQTADVEYKRQFEDEIAAFIGRIERRAKEKIEEAIKEQQEEEERERLARLGPGGLDPAEVFETLPKELQECFEKRDTELLKEVIAKMPEEDAKYHMKRCVDSGLWVADAQAAAAATQQDEEPTYEVPKVENLDLD